MQNNANQILSKNMVSMDIIYQVIKSQNRTARFLI